MQFQISLQAHVGHIARNQVWVFGMVDTLYTPARGYIEIVPDRSRATLTAVISQHLNPNSVVHSDMWRGYLTLPVHGPNCIQHDTVNHTLNFVDPITGVHTQVNCSN